MNYDESEWKLAHTYADLRKSCPGHTQNSMSDGRLIRYINHKHPCLRVRAYCECHVCDCLSYGYVPNVSVELLIRILFSNYPHYSISYWEKTNNKKAYWEIMEIKESAISVYGDTLYDVLIEAVLRSKD